LQPCRPSTWCCQDLATLSDEQAASTSQLHEAAMLEQRLKSEVHALTAQLATACRPADMPDSDTGSDSGSESNDSSDRSRPEPDLEDA
jgi:hypothetical protein